MGSKQKRFLSFDMDTNELKKYYPTDNWRNAYEDVKKHMQKNGFEWLQGSSYISKKAISIVRMHKIINNLTKKYPWINKSMRDCRVANVDKYSNLTLLFDKSTDVPVRAGYQTADRESQKRHIQELKRNGFQPNKEILAKMQQIDKNSGKYMSLKEIRDIYKGVSNTPPECKQLANEIGQALKSQELVRVSYR